MKRILRRRPEVDTAEDELLQARVLERLQGNGDSASRAVPEAPVEVPETAVGVMAEPDSDAWQEPVGVMAVPDVEPEAEAEADVVVDEPEAVVAESIDEDATVDVDATSDAVATIESDSLIDDDAPLESLAGSMDLEPMAEAPDAVAAEAIVEEPTVVAAAEVVAEPPETAPPETELAAILDDASTDDEPEPESTPAATTTPTTTARARTPTPRPKTARPAAAKPVPVAPAAPAPYCPYCALLLDPPPETSRRCPRCRERIMVKHVDGRSIYLTEASVAIFDAERKRAVNSGRWTKERAKWIKAAASVDAPADKIARLEKAPLSDEVVASSRNLYFGTVDRAFRAAKRERRWEDASEIMRAHALVLFKLAGSPIPPPDDALDAHRHGAAAALRGLGEMSRVVELVSGRCCDTCRADDGGVFKVATELRQPRLPHAGCPKGLCRCDWFLAVRDQSLVRRQLKRRARSESAIRTAT